MLIVSVHFHVKRCLYFRLVDLPKERRDRYEEMGRVRERERASEQSCTDGPDAVTDWHADTHFLFAAHNLPNDA